MATNISGFITINSLSIHCSPVPAPDSASTTSDTPVPQLEPEPRRSPRLARARANTEPFIYEQNPIPEDTWIKLSTVPTHLRFILDPRCNLWDVRVQCDLLRQLIRHFSPHVFVRVRTSKAEYVRIFYDNVVSEFGQFYGY
ncbi:uncharacterized protein MELLADRAFT_70097 [Melampsora larici-populina 98AG31]|uniref:Uncharacterized protein n=1 Tax=Melampsora larici-populina (strain 98AG31 / pathotype 3-4-7) TaxID=747676 RepID=F4SDJ9_MELLP|nr:uncharacterized protein MELLADRAFT_70097 [Melampsora larici-populina 98AG31]EGF97277.1 hypothetical protein MELLADRAFT_70097 [Melampsora larici-populina 98AG31]